MFEKFQPKNIQCQRLNKNLNKRVPMLGTAIVIAIPATRSSSTEGDDELTNHNYMGTEH